MADISIIIVTWNSENEINACVDSVVENILNMPAKDIELIIVDNYSSDKTPSFLTNISYSNLQIYNNKENIGFTKAVNYAIGYANGNYIFLLNPDTVLDKDCMEKLYNFLSVNSDYSAVCPKLLNEDGSVQFSIRKFPKYISLFFEFILLSYLFPKSKVFNNWKMEYFDYSKDADVLQPMAAALLIRNEFLNNNKKMDEQFEMFFNDVDLCKMISDSGKKIRYLSAAKAVHKKGASIYKNRIKMIRIWNKDCIAYFEKYHNNFILLLWLRINLRITSFIRIIFYKLFSVLTASPRKRGSYNFN